MPTSVIALKHTRGKGDNKVVTTRNVTLKTRDFPTVQSITENVGSESLHCIAVAQFLHEQVKGKARGKFNALENPTQEAADKIVRDLENSSIVVRVIDPEMARSHMLMAQLKELVASGNFTADDINNFFAQNVK